VGTRYHDYLQEIFHRFGRERSTQPATLHEVVEWAVSQKLLEVHRVDPLAQLVEDIGRALREEYRTDKRGRRYRLNHAVHVSRDGQQFSLWADMRFASRHHMERAFAQRRKQIVGDCLQLRIDVDAYNEAHPKDDPIQLVLNFENDVQEMLLSDGRFKGAA
jgi:uncharacterized protein (DUF2461 family)